MSKLSNKNLVSASKRDTDELYTSYNDIKEECDNYRAFFKDKIIYCNCDNPLQSNFFLYFANNFNALGIKKLICTCCSIESSLKDNSYNFIKVNNPPKTGYKLELNNVIDINGDTAINGLDVILMVKELFDNPNNEEIKKYISFSYLYGDNDYMPGDFRSKECCDILSNCDMVVSSSVFSLYHEYIKQLMDYKKEFLISCNLNAFTYSDVFPLFKEGKMWVGYHNNVSKTFMDNFGNEVVNGFTYWVTNLPVRKRKTFILFNPDNKYTPIKYPRFDNYDAIYVNKTKDIPCDYFGVMGVPISFLNCYCPDQFEIVYGMDCRDNKNLKEQDYIPYLRLNGKSIYRRILIKRIK